MLYTVAIRESYESDRIQGNWTDETEAIEHAKRVHAAENHANGQGMYADSVVVIATPLGELNRNKIAIIKAIAFNVPVVSQEEYLEFLLSP